METLTLTKQHFDNNNVYIGNVDVTNYNGNILITENLGKVHFPKALCAKGFIQALNGTGIRAGSRISAGSGISAGYGISAGDGIFAGSGISAGYGISAGAGISAGSGISAGLGICAGEGIATKQEIKCGKGYFVLAGTNSWNMQEYEIKCTKLVGGKVKLGKLVLIEPGKKATPVMAR